MDIKGLIQDLKSVVSKYKDSSKETFATVVAKGKLNDDVTEITWDTETLGTGSIVSVYDTTGALLPLPAGNYTLEDGTTFIIVDNMGTADNVVLAQTGSDTNPAGTETPAPAPNQMSEAEVTKTAGAVAKTIIESTIKESRFVSEDFVADAIKTALEEKEKFAKEQSDKIVALEGTLKELFALVEKIGELPGEDSTEKNKNSFKKKTAKELSLEFKNALK